MISVFGLTDKGLHRKDNQDAMSYNVITENTAWGVVCDGMGGTSSGDIASKIATVLFEDAMGYYYNEKGDKVPPVALLREIVAKANEMIIYYGEENPECLGMGTTLVATMIEDSLAYVVNVGDSRAYHISHDSICCMTRDHSVVQMLVESGNITAEEARCHPQKNIITRALGTSNTVEGDIYEYNLKEGDWLLLCSDGLINEVEDSEMLSLVASELSPEEIARGLLDLVLSRGARDNVTIVLFHMEKETGKEEA